MRTRTIVILALVVFAAELAFAGWLVIENVRHCGKPAATTGSAS